MRTHIQPMSITDPFYQDQCLYWHLIIGRQVVDLVDPLQFLTLHTSNHVCLGTFYNCPTEFPVDFCASPLSSEAHIMTKLTSSS